MDLGKPSVLNTIAKRASGPLSHAAASRLLEGPLRVVDAYLNFVLGKGAGTGWDIDHEVALALTRIKSERPVVFDIGANVGDWTARLLALRPDARVWMFEPSPECQQHLRARDLGQALLVPCAVGEQPGRASLHFSSSFDGSASLHERGDSYFQHSVYATTDVDVIAMDDFIAANDIPFVDFVKLDIEGHELFALRGAEKSLRARKIGALAFEFGSADINSRTFFRDFWDFLTDHGFAVERLTPGGNTVLIGEYYEDLEYYRGATNYFAHLKTLPAP
jgi:FkbM family methyltransferase